MARDSLHQFSQDIRIPTCQITDLTGDHTGKCTEFMQQVRYLDIDITWSEKGHKNQNHIPQDETGILKKCWGRRMIELSIPLGLWDYGFVYEGDILSQMCHHSDQHTGYEMLTSQTPDISEWLNYGFYNLVWYHHSTSHNMTDDPCRLG